PFEIPADHFSGNSPTGIEAIWLWRWSHNQSFVTHLRQRHDVRGEGYVGALQKALFLLRRDELDAGNWRSGGVCKSLRDGGNSKAILGCLSEIVCQFKGRLREQ